VAVHVKEVRELLDQAVFGETLDIPVHVLGDAAAASLVFPGGALRIEGVSCDPEGAWVTGHAVTTAIPSPVPVRVAFTGDGEQVVGVLAAADLGGGRGLLLINGTPAGAPLPPGAWLVAGGRETRLSGRTPVPEADPGRLDGLGRALPRARPRTAAERERERGPRALVTEHGILAPRPAERRRKGVRLLQSPTVRGWSPIGPPGGENGLAVDYLNPPLRITGALTALPAEPPYKAIVGGALLVDTGAFNGSAMGAYVVPDGSGAEPSFFAYGSLGSATGFGPPPFQVRGIAAGFGWNSRVRVPAADGLGSFPFMAALDNPGDAWADGDALGVLSELIAGSNPWVRPQEGGLWIAAGLAFDSFETFRGHAMALVQLGSDLTIGLLGVGGAQLPTDSEKKIARVEIGIEATLRPTAGELSISAGFTEKTFLIDPACKVRGGVGVKFWFGDHPHAGDFALLLGAVPRAREADLPARYPKGQDAGMEWGIGSTVDISGSAYAGLTPKSLMAGGRLDVVFHSGMLRAWLSARVDALLEWNPFYFDLGIGVRVGVSATIKVWFVKIKISVEIGVSVRVWGPPVGGEATVHLWFVSFTIGFGHRRRDGAPALGWGGFQGMLPAPETMVRTTPVTGYVGEGAPATRGATKPWLVDSGGFTFTADTQAPVSAVYLDESGTTPVFTDDGLDILPMRLRDKGSELRVWLTRDGGAETLTDWARTALRGNVPNGLWGERADAPGDGLIRDRIIGIRLVSPPVDHGTSTGFIDEEGIGFDPLAPDGNQPLSASEEESGRLPLRPGGVIGKIQDGIGRNGDRAHLVTALGTLGIELGPLDADLSAYASAAGTAFTADPMLIAA
jgi:hypothetical protein